MNYVTVSAIHALKLFFPFRTSGLDFLIEIDMDEVQVGSSSEEGSLDIAALQRQLQTTIFGIGDRLLYIPIITSTNSLAMQLAQERPDEGVVVLTDSQTAGKGRQGRRWVDVFGCNVLSSTLLRPLFPPHLLVMIASLAVVDAINASCNVAATIKWPNDVLIEDRKVAGILIETSHDISGQLVAILGIGVNVNGQIQHVPVGASLVTSSAQDTYASSVRIATTLAAECGHPVSREAFIANMLQYIEADYLALQHEANNPLSVAYGLSLSRSLRERWRNHLSTLGRTIQVYQGDTILTGIAEDVDDNGELLLRRHSGDLVSITWGDVGYPTR